MSNITEAQKQAITLIKDMGGWVTWDYLKRMGMKSAAPLSALVGNDVIEVRNVETASGFDIKQWRIKE